MNRRNFIKGFLAATGTLAVAPAVALEPVKDYTKCEIWPLLEGMIESQKYLNREMLKLDLILSLSSKHGIPIRNPETYFIGEDLGIIAGS